VRVTQTSLPGRLLAGEWPDGHYVQELGHATAGCRADAGRATAPDRGARDGRRRGVRPRHGAADLPQRQGR
jgi:hypothetical protein